MQIPFVRSPLMRERRVAAALSGPVFRTRLLWDTAFLLVWNLFPSLLPGPAPGRQGPEHTQCTEMKKLGLSSCLDSPSLFWGERSNFVQSSSCLLASVCRVSRMKRWPGQWKRLSTSGIRDGCCTAILKTAIRLNSASRRPWDFLRASTVRTAHSTRARAPGRCPSITRYRN